MNNPITSAMCWLEEYRANSSEDKRKAERVLLTDEAEREIDITLWRGEVYITIGGFPCLQCDSTKQAQERVEGMRKRWVEWNTGRERRRCQ